MWWLCVWLAVAGDELVLNEILFDPPGPDAGQEFIEIHNPGDASVDLESVVLRFVNGSAPDHPVEVWRGDPASVVPPGGFFVVGGELVPGRDRTVDPGLQNGDEAVELWRGAVRLDAVAWGEDLGLGEGAPAAGGRGRSIGRVPDGIDRDDNSIDLRELPQPTPGAANLPENGFALAAWWTRPVWVEEPGPALFHARVTVTGWGPRQSGVLLFGSDSVALDAAPGDTLAFALPIEVPLGRLPVDLRLGASRADAAPAGPTGLWGGLHDLAITEVQPRPADGEPEWFEIVNRGGGAVELAGWSIRDRGGVARQLAASGSIAPGERLVFTSDAAALRRRYPWVTARILEPVGGWATLNDSSPATAVAADSLHLLLPDAAVVDLVCWERADLQERGRPLQRGALRVGSASIWMPAVGGPTPGGSAAEESRVWPTAGLDCSPDPFTPDGDGNGDQLEVLVVGSSTVARTSVLDLQGDVVRVLEPVASSGRAAARWDGRDERGEMVPAGAYVVVVDLMERSGATRRLRRVVGLGRRR